MEVHSDYSHHESSRNNYENLMRESGINLFSSTDKRNIRDTITHNQTSSAYRND